MPPAPKISGGQDSQALGRSRGGFTNKIHVTVDGLENPLRLLLTAGQRQDIKVAHDLIAGLKFDCLLADRGYAAQQFYDEMVAQGMQPVIPPHQRSKTAHEYDRWLYRERHLVECFINKIKHFRRVFSRFDKLSIRYLGFVQFVSALIWLR